MRVVFLCTHNSARSQMAEALLRHDWEQRVPGLEAHSAGVVARGVHPAARQALEDLGIETRGLESKTIDALRHSLLRSSGGDADFDVVVTVCDNAREACPYLPARRVNLHHRFVDPSEGDGSDEEVLERFVATRDEIRAWLEEVVPEWIDSISASDAAPSASPKG